jgi:DHA2 family multidrug resistance protein
VGASKYSRLERALVAPFVILAAMIDTTIANVVLPPMQCMTGASREEISWVLTSYIIAMAMIAHNGSY